MISHLNNCLQRRRSLCQTPIVVVGVVLVFCLNINTHTDPVSLASADLLEQLLWDLEAALQTLPTAGHLDRRYLSPQTGAQLQYLYISIYSLSLYILAQIILP